MPSFELIFEEDEDVLEVTFEIFEEAFARTISLNDNILIYTDLALNTIWGITFYSFSQLLQVSETHLDGLSPLPPADQARLLALLSRPPATYFLEIRDSAALRALVKAPSLRELMDV